jgi:pyrimidine-nucleoside phosphorylase
MVAIGTQFNRKTLALLTDMNQPLNSSIGNALEVKEASKTLKNQGNAALTQLCLKLGAAMLCAGGYSEDMSQAETQLKHLLESGQALEKWRQIIAAQGGDPGIVDDPSRLPQAENTCDLKAATSGYIHRIQPREVGTIAMLLGAGRQRKEDTIDAAAGIELYKQCGDWVNAGETLARLHSRKTDYLTVGREKLQQSIHIYDHPPELNESLVVEVITA